MQGLAMRYRPELSPALVGVDLAVPDGRTVGMVGRTARSSLPAGAGQQLGPTDVGVAH
jgi:hypothetical protein